MLKSQVQYEVRCCYELSIKETVAIFPLLFSVHKKCLDLLLDNLHKNLSGLWQCTQT